MLKDKRRLTAAVLLSCSFFMAPYYAHAEEEEDVPDCGHGKNYMDISVSNGTNQLTYRFDIYTASTHPGPHWWGEYKEDDDGDPVLDEDGNKVKEYVSYRDLFAGEQEAFGDSIGYIHQMIRPAANASTPYINLELLPDEDANAAAESSTYVEKYDDGKPKTQISDTELGAVLQGKYLPSGDDPVARIEVNLAPPDTIWYIDKFTALPSNGTDSDYYGTITHEMFHALGLGTYLNEDTSTNEVTFGTNVNYQEGNILRSQAVFNKYEMGLRDAFGRVGYYAYDSANQSYTYYDGNGVTIAEGITSTNDPINPNSPPTITGELTSRKIVPITLSKYNAMKDDPSQRKADEFYVIRDSSESTNCGAYFTGANVLDVLTTNGQKATIAWPDGSSVPGVIGGIPLNGYEGSDDSKPELSHLELQNGLMSHQSYRNWCNFMEVELALLKDLGYNVDLGAYYGKSIYNSGITYTNNQGFFNRIQSGNAWTYGTSSNTQTHGTGLHIYGSNNTITQSGTIMADGYSGIGIRVDGVNNNLTISKTPSDTSNIISADGKYGNGLLVAYGKNHTITLKSGNSITATGEGGVAARFDFGSNELGDTAGYRGSYINVEYDDKNAKWVEKTIPTAIQGPLVSTFNVDGTLNGNLAAIYISPNALVKNINIGSTGNITGDIISEWNPDAIFYQNEDGEILAPDLPDVEDGMTNLNFAGTHNFGYNIKGKDSIVLNVGTTAISTLDTGSTSIINIKALNIGSDTTNSTFNNKGDLYVDQGAGIINIASDSTLDTTGGRIFSLVDDDGVELQFTGGGLLNFGTTPNTSTLLLGMKHDFYDGNVELTMENPGITIYGSPTINLYEQSPTLDFEGRLDGHTYIISMRRNYEQYAYDGGTSSLSNVLVQNAAFLGNNSAHADDWQKIYEGIDFSNPDGSDVPGMLKQLNPSVYSNSAQATINTHSMLNNMNMLGTFSSLNVPPARTGGGRGPAAEEAPKYNSWRNMVMPFTSYTDQHNGNRGYTNHNSGVIGAMERTLENGLTHGYHAALNHQSTSEAGSRIKGEGLYLGTQATYAPADWKGWQIFGSARLGIEQMRSHRNINIGGYSGVADSDWTGYSGSLSVGTALNKEHGIMESGPFAALDYSFAHRPSVHEDGGAISTKISSATYNSLRTQLGYRLTTKPKALDSYDSTKWQAHASVAWNHELLSDNGRTSYQFSDLPGVTISDTVDTYGRDSMSIAAGVTFKTPKCLDVTLTIGSDMYRKGGSSVYGKANFEWKF